MPLSPLLLVDDEAMLRLSLRAALTRDGYRVEVAESTEDALEKLQQQSFDIVVTDLQMPGASGLDLIAALKTRSPESLAIVMTGYATVNTAIEAIKLGAYDFIQKPFRIADLEMILDRAYETIDLKRQMQNYQNDLEHRMARRIQELQSFQEEAKQLHELLHQGFKESNLQKAIEPLLKYAVTHFKLDAYALIFKGHGNALGYLIRSGHLQWPEAKDLMDHPDAWHENDGDASLIPLGEGSKPVAWLYLGFKERSAFQVDDPLFGLWKTHLSTALELMKTSPS